MDNIFADNISRADFLGGMIRLELSAPVPGPNGEAVVAPSGQVIYMPLEGFLRSAQMVDDFLKKLIEAGLVTHNPAQPAPPTSPNFTE